MPNNKSLPLLFAYSLFFKEQFERFAAIALYKKATMSDLLGLLMTKERRERFILFHEQIALLLTNNKWIAQKNDERSKNKTLVQDQHELFYLLKLVGKKKELKWKR